MEGFAKRTQLLQRSINPFLPLVNSSSAPRNRRRWAFGIDFRCTGFFAVLFRTRHGLIIYVAVQPPNDKVLWITLAFLVLTAILWYAF